MQLFTFIILNLKIKKIRPDRESNPGLVRDRDVF